MKVLQRILGSERRKVFVHIGMHTAGSSAIQRMLRLNASLLREQSYLYPDTGLHPATLEQHDLLFQSLSSSSDNVDHRKPNHVALFKALVKEIEKSRCTSVIISAENLWLLKTEEVNEFARHFLNYDIIPIIFIRRFSDLLEDLHLYKINNDPTYVDLSNTKQEFWHAHESMSFEQCIRDWSSIAFEGRLAVHSYDCDDCDPNSEFCNFVGLDSSKFSKPKVIQPNQKAIFSEAVRIACVRHNISEKNTEGLIRQLSVLHFNEQHTLMPDSIRAKLDESYARQVADMLKLSNIIPSDITKWRIKRTGNPIQINGMLSVLFAIGRSIASDARFKS